jgi:hypothetical protein
VAAEPVGQRGWPVGKIHERVGFWVEHFCPDAYVRGILDPGFKVPVDWEKIPEAYEEADNKSARTNYDFVRQEVARLLGSGQVVEWDTKPRCCNPLTVAVKRMDNGELKKRLVLDLLRCVNLAVKDDSAPPIALILRTIRKIEVTKMTGVLLIPLWRGARFWLHAFPDGRHLGGVFRSFSQLKAKTRLWGTTPKDAFAGKWVVFLALEINSRGDGGSLELVVSRTRCFGRLFGYDCIC